MKPIRVTPQFRIHASACTTSPDVMANHEPFTDHMLTDWECSGPEYAWKQAPLSERVAAPLVRAILSSASQRALARLTEQLPQSLGPVHTGPWAS